MGRELVTEDKDLQQDKLPLFKMRKGIFSSSFTDKFYLRKLRLLQVN